MTLEGTGNEQKQNEQELQRNLAIVQFHRSVWLPARLRRGPSWWGEVNTPIWILHVGNYMCERFKNGENDTVNLKTPKNESPFF